MKRKRLRFHQVNGGYSQTYISANEEFFIVEFNGSLRVEGNPILIINLKTVTCVEIEEVDHSHKDVEQARNE